MGEIPQRSPRGAPDAQTLAAFVAIVVLLGANFVAVRFSNRDLAPFWGGGARFAAATLILLVALAILRVPLPRGRALAGAILYGALGFGATYALLYWALVRVPAGMTSVVFATIPLMTLLVATGIGLERFGWRALAGALVTMFGIGIAFLDQVRADVPLLSLLAVLAAAFTAAASAIVVKRFPRNHPAAGNAVGMGVGALILLAGSLVAGETRGLPSLGATWLALAWLVGSSVIAFVLFVWVLARWTASAASYAGVLAPLVTVSVAAALAGEGVTLPFALGGAIALAGVYVGAIAPSGRAAGPERAPAPEPRAPQK